MECHNQVVGTGTSVRVDRPKVKMGDTTKSGEGRNRIDMKAEDKVVSVVIKALNAVTTMLGEWLQQLPG